MRIKNAILKRRANINNLYQINVNLIIGCDVLLVCKKD